MIATYGRALSELRTCLPFLSIALDVGRTTLVTHHVQSIYLHHQRPHRGQFRRCCAGARRSTPRYCQDPRTNCTQCVGSLSTAFFCLIYGHSRAGNTEGMFVSRVFFHLSFLFARMALKILIGFGMVERAHGYPCPDSSKRGIFCVIQRFALCLEFSCVNAYSVLNPYLRSYRFASS
jgi:hypothetical protein